MKKEEIASREKKNIRNKILVNLITGIRSLGSIAIIPIFLNLGAFATGISAIIFFLTDFIDGKLARKLKVQSFFGSLLDALSDKTFGIVCLIILSTINPAFLTIIFTELFISYINYKSLQRGNNTQSSMAGKIKTFFLAGTIVGSFFSIGAPTLKEVLNYANVKALNNLLEINPLILTTCLIVPTLISNVFVAADYSVKAQKQDKKRAEDISKIEQNITNIASERNKLLLEKEQIKKLKSKPELLHDLFDTEFYLENKDGSIKKLFYKWK